MIKNTSKGLAFALVLPVVALSGISFAAPAKEESYKAKPSTYEKLAPAKKGGEYFLSLSNNPKVINPILSADANSSALEPYIWATLFTEDAETLQPLPYLAETYTISADRKSYTFKLNKNAKWDDGTPVTAEDVRFSFDTLMNPKTDAAAARSYWEGVKLDVVDPMTVKFTVESPKFDTLRTLYLFNTISKKQFEKEADFNKSKGILAPVGNGPYVFKSFSRDQKVELERKKDWWGYELKHFKERFNADKITLRIIPDSNLEYERFLKGELDVKTFDGPGAETFATKVRGTDKEKIGTSSTDGKNLWASEFENKAPRGFSYIGWNLRLPLFSSVKTRRALALLIDYQQIVNNVFYGFYYQSSSPFGSKTLNSNADLRKPGTLLAFDKKKAIELLKEDGWKDEDKNGLLEKMIDGKKVEFKFTLKYNSNNPARGKIAQIVKENLKVAGIQMDIRSMEWNAFLEDVDNRKFDCLILGWTASPYPNPKQIWHSSSEANQGSNFVGYSNKKVDDLIDRANLEFDLKKRAKMLGEINKIIYEDQPYAFLLEPRSMLAGFNNKVKSKVWAMAYDVGPATDIYTVAP